MKEEQEKDGLAEHGVEVTCAGVVLVLLLIFLFRVYSDWRDKRQKRLVTCRPHEMPILMMLPGIHKIATEHVTFLCGAESFDGDRPSYNTRYCHSDDFQFIERLLQKTFPNHVIRVPETTVAVSIPRKHFVCGDPYTCFYPASGPSIRSHCTYKMLSPRVQATYYVKRATSYLAGLTIYPRLLIDVKNQSIPLEKDNKLIVRALRKKDDYIPRPFSFSEKLLETKWCHAHQKRLVIIRNKYGLDWKYYFNQSDGYFELVRCNECCAGGSLHIIRNHLRSILNWKLAALPVSHIAPSPPPPPYVQIDGPPPSYASIIFDEVSTDV